ncbi:TolC family protein [Deinococcus misasensis]|uniref:TolC family protein n=1 Tax=Deinococcus misasensis TaxID=392413 RepID=UPI0005533BC5|nr:TolC family protein [Deinococcus misasensis]
MKQKWWLLGVVLSVSMGHAQAWVSELLKHPSVQAAQLQVRAAQAQVDGLNSPVTLVGQSNFQSSDFLDAPAGVPAGQWPQDSSSWDATLTAAFKLFPYGDAADQLAQAQLGVQQAQLGFRSALTAAQVQVMSAAYQLQLAQQGKALAQSAEQLAFKSLEVARLRASKGGISPAELRDSENAYQQAQEQLKAADENIRLAELNLSLWVGNQKVEIPENLKYPTSALSAEQQSALFAREQTRIQVEGIKRRFLPVLNASYTYQLDDNNFLIASLDSGSLQPALTYNYQSKPAQTQVLNSQIKVGLKFTLTPSIADALSAADAQMAAADLNVKNAARSRELQEASLKVRHEQAQRQLVLKSQAVSNATLALSEAQKREELGLNSPLQTLKAILDLSQAQLAERQAKLDVLSRTLDVYRFYALPPIEVNP